MKTLVLLISLIFSFTVVAEVSDGQWVDDWWEETYKQNIQQEQKLQIEKKAQTKCDRKIEHYTFHLNEKPNSKYYKWKLGVWEERCF